MSNKSDFRMVRVRVDTWKKLQVEKLLRDCDTFDETLNRILSKKKNKIRYGMLEI